MNSINDLKIVNDLWKNRSEGLICPKCKAPLTMIQQEPVFDSEGDYTPYKTIIECSQCSFHVTTESFTILGSVKKYTTTMIEIGSWTTSGSRAVSTFNHILNHDLLSTLEQSGELVEFLIVGKQVVQVIG